MIVYNCDVENAAGVLAMQRLLLKLLLVVVVVVVVLAWVGGSGGAVVVVVVVVAVVVDAVGSVVSVCADVAAAAAAVGVGVGAVVVVVVVLSTLLSTSLSLLVLVAGGRCLCPLLMLVRPGGHRSTGGMSAAAKAGAGCSRACVKRPANRHESLNHGL